MYRRSVYFFIIIYLAVVESVSRGNFISIKEAPYYVSLVINDNHAPYCSGAIISDYWIITAAHCLLILHDKPSAAPIQVRSGSTWRNSQGDIYDVEQILVFPDHEYRATSTAMAFNDMALLKLKSPIIFDEYQMPVKIRSRKLHESGIATAVGLGREDSERFSPSLKATEFQYYPEVQASVNKLGSSWLVLIGTGTQICQGDSGGPLIFDGELVGVLSASPECIRFVGNQTKPRNTFNFYSRLDRNYDWIIKQTGIRYS